MGNELKTMDNSNSINVAHKPSDQIHCLSTERKLFLSSFLPLFLSFTTWSSDREQMCVIIFECVEHPPSPPAPPTTTTTSTSRKWRWRKYTRIFTPTSAVGKTQKKICRERVPQIHTKGRKRDTHGGNNSALASYFYCKFSVGRFFFTFVILPVPVVKKQILIWVLHINGTGNLVGGGT